MHKRWAAIIGLLVLVFLPLNANAAETGTTKFSVDLNQPVLELTVPTNPAIINLEPVATGDSFGSTNIAIRVATNNVTGYTLTMNPSNNVDNTSLIRTELLTEESTYRTIGTLAQTDPVSTGYTEQSFTANKWGYKITGDNYYGIDPNNTTVSHPAWVGNDPTNGINHNLTLGVKINANTVSGSYETTLNFRAVTNAVVAKDTVTFNGNGADSGDMSGDSLVVVSGESETLPANAYTKSGYAFLGWNTAQNGSGLSYADEGTYTAVSTDYSHNVTLYAMWMDTSSGIYNKLHPGGSGLSGGITISRAYEIAYTNAGKGMWERDEGDRDNDGDTSEYYQVTDGIYHNYDVSWDMQGMTPEICNSVEVMEDDYRALDVRDWKLYHITKLKDGNCWMTQNIDLDLLTSVTFYNADTDLNSKASWTPDANIKRFTGDTDPGGSSGNTSIYSADPGDAWVVPMLDTESNDSLVFTLNECIQITGSEDACEHLYSGNYYNWSAAVASNDTSAMTAEGTRAPDSMCPKGWRMPIEYRRKEGSYTYKTSDYGNLLYASGVINGTEASGSSTSYNPNGIIMRKDRPLFFASYGRTYGGLMGWRTREGGYWMSTLAGGSNGDQYSFYTNGGGVGIAGGGIRHMGLPVRCIAR